MRLPNRNEGEAIKLALRHQVRDFVRNQPWLRRSVTKHTMSICARPENFSMRIHEERVMPTSGYRIHWITILKVNLAWSGFVQRGIVSQATVLVVSHTINMTIHCQEQRMIMAS
jgi:hypothetical protein